MCLYRGVSGDLWLWLHNYLSRRFQHFWVTSGEQVDRVERRATNNILGDCKLYYKEHLFALGLLLLMYELEINDVMFCIKSLKSPAKDFR